MKLSKKKLLFFIIFLIAVLISFFFFGNEKENRQTSYEKEEIKYENKDTLNKEEENNKDKEEKVKAENKNLDEEDISKNEKNTNTDKGNKKEENLNPSEKEKKEVKNQKKEENSKIKDKKIDKKNQAKKSISEKEDDEQSFCYLTVQCSSILENIDKLEESKKEVLPKDGIIFKRKKVIFYEGETVFNVLQREMKKNKIHMEFTMTPVYSSNYIEGIGNIYQFDCGELSGWMYSVNGKFPNYGSSRCKLHEGDEVQWIYTCDLGKDIGNEYKLKDFYDQDKGDIDEKD